MPRPTISHLPCFYSEASRHLFCFCLCSQWAEATWIVPYYENTHHMHAACVSFTRPRTSEPRKSYRNETSVDILAFAIGSTAQCQAIAVSWTVPDAASNSHPRSHVRAPAESSFALLCCTLRCFLSFPRPNPLNLSKIAPHAFDCCKARKNIALYECLERARDEFEDGRHTTFEKLQLKLKSWIALLLHDDQRFSSGRRSVRGCARRILMSVDQMVGSDVSTLCMRCTTIDRLAKTQEAGFLQDLVAWWNDASHPPLLSDATLKIRQRFPEAKLPGIAPAASKMTFSLFGFCKTNTQ